MTETDKTRQRLRDLFETQRLAVLSIRVKVDCYYLVSRFQNVVELHIRH